MSTLLRLVNSLFVDRRVAANARIAIADIYKTSFKVHPNFTMVGYILLRFKCVCVILKTNTLYLICSFLELFKIRLNNFRFHQSVKFILMLM